MTPSPIHTLVGKFAYILNPQIIFRLSPQEQTLIDVLFHDGLNRQRPAQHPDEWFFEYYITKT